MANSAGESDIYDEALLQRKSYVDAILKSDSRKKTVVAGPGTGKTFLFRTVLPVTAIAGSRIRTSATLSWHSQGPKRRCS